MTQPSKGAVIFLTLFALPFLGLGLAAFFGIVTAHPSGVPNTITGSMLAVLFVLVGGGLIAGAMIGYRRQERQAALEMASPGEPWLWKADWAARRAAGQGNNKEALYWILCIFWNGISIPIAVSVVPALARAGNPQALVPAGFCVIGAILLIVALRASLRHRRFRDTYFEFESLPILPGQRLKGAIQLRLDTRAEHGIDLTLQCVRKTVTGSGKSRSIVMTVLWQSDQNVPQGALGTGPLGTAIPVDFAVPADALVTDRENPSDQVLWLLRAKADVPGIDYKDEFELPVFRTSGATDSVKSRSAIGDGVLGGVATVISPLFGGSAMRQNDPTPVTAPAHPKVRISMQPGGTEFYFPPLRNPARAGLIFIFAAVWSGLVYVLFHSRAPFPFAGIFGLADFVLIAGVFHSVLVGKRVLVGSGEIRWRSEALGVGVTRRIAFSEIQTIVPVTGGQQSGDASSAMYAIRMRSAEGRTFTLADEIDSRQEARWIVSQIESLAGLKADTNVEIESPFGAPPQPGTVRAPAARQAQTSAVASIAIVAVFVATVFWWQGRRFASLRMATTRASTARAGANVSITPRVFAKPMTDADEARILASPIQEQAEELLERAIGHDARALELFEQQSAGWTSEIRMTDRMRRLEERSRFSKDLRVRYANADINLAAEGWAKNADSAAKLLERARIDVQYRPAAVYFLGMLAGQGVDYDEIHAALWNYARHDQNPTVRQWAVEGMRYLGKDEVLDELWESFTQDPSFAVRDRAGCNLSDCGNFKRAQRMRMVPKFLDLAANSATPGQMRGWCFMALQEITGETLPGDATLWMNWYQQYGSEKQAEFERLEWWQVRGDE